MTFACQQVLALARTEWRLVWRGLGLRLVLVMLAIPFIPYLLLAHPLTDDGGLGLLSFAAPFAGLLAAFLIVPSIGRERAARIADLTWVRPLSGGAYVAGKLLAALLVMAVLLAELTALVAVGQLAAGRAIGYPLLAGALLVTAPSLALAAVLYLVCAVLLPRPFLGYVVALGLAVLFALYLNGSMLVLGNPWAHGLFYNTAIGFGPDWPLLLANRLFYAGIAVGMVGLVLLLFARRERQALATRGQGRRAVLLLACGVAFAGVALPRFQAASAAVSLSGPVAVPKTVALSLRDYRLDLRLDPASGAAQGEARFTITNIGAVPVAALPIYLNDGLRLGGATVGGHPAAVTGGVLFGGVALVPALAPGDAAAIRLSYAGRYKLLHAQYGSIYRGLQAPVDQSSGAYASLFQPAIHQTVIGDDLAQLFRDGDWYPWPWTEGVVGRAPAPLGWRGLRLRLPAGVTAVASTSDRRRAGDEQVFTWTLQGRLPSAVLAVIPGRYTRIAVPDGAVYAPAGDEAALRARYGPYVAALRDLQAFFGRPRGQITVVAMPLPTSVTGLAIPPALGGDLVLAPVGGVDRSPGDSATGTARLPAPAPYRAALDDLAAAWWADHLLAYPGGLMTYDGREDLPAGTIDLTERGWFYNLSLTGYTGAAVAGERLGSAAYRNEMALRRAVDTLRLRDQAAAYFVLQRNQGPLARAVDAVGLQGRLGDNATPDATVALDDLRGALGAEHLRRLLIGLAAGGGIRNDEGSIACALHHATGRSVAALMNRYLTGPFAIRTTGGCA